MGYSRFYYFKYALFIQTLFGGCNAANLIFLYFWVIFFIMDPLYSISRKRKPEEISDKEKEDANLAQEKKAKVVGDELLTSRTGGAYIPPAKLRMMQAQIKDKSR